MIAIAVVIAFLAGCSITALISSTPRASAFWKSPFSGIGHFLLIARDFDQFVVARDIFEGQGFPPRLRLHTTGALRLFFERRFALHLPSEKMRSLAEQSCFGIEFIAEDPKWASEFRAQWIRKAGFTANVVHDPDPGFLPGALSVVATDAISGLLLVYRKRDGKMGAWPEPLFS